jgi:uncharacterized membrane protein
MIEIIPNWHPIFVHFTVGLLSISVFFYLLAFISNYLTLVPNKVRSELEIVARWCLWSGAFITIGTVLAGFYAYNTVNHDTPSHMAMTNHRNWAIATAVVAILIALWSVWRHHKQKASSISFILALLIMQGLLLSAAWRGGEIVYRYGLGVMSLPNIANESNMDHHNQKNIQSLSVDNKPTSQEGLTSNSESNDEPPCVTGKLTSYTLT